LFKYVHYASKRHKFESYATVCHKKALFNAHNFLVFQSIQSAHTLSSPSFKMNNLSNPQTATATASNLPQRTNLALQPNTRLGAFEIRSVLEHTISTVTYLAIDHALEKQVAIEEYVPSRLVTRDTNQHLQPLAKQQKSVIARGLRAFTDETRMLARCNHPSLVQVLQLIEANGTSYRVMQHQEGQRLLDVRRKLQAAPDEGFLWELLEGLIGALEAIHQTGYAHGGVSPENILLLPGGRPLLLGRGAAEAETTSALVASLMATLTPAATAVTNSTPPDDAEPSAEPQAFQPSVTGDIHALAQVIRFCITGVLPVSQNAHPAHQPITELIAETLELNSRPYYSATLLNALDQVSLHIENQQPLDFTQLKNWLFTDGEIDSSPTPLRATLRSTSHGVWSDATTISAPVAVPPQPANGATPTDDGVAPSVPSPGHQSSPASAHSTQPREAKPNAKPNGEPGFTAAPILTGDPAPWSPISRHVAQQVAAAKKRKLLFLGGALAFSGAAAVAIALGAWLWQPRNSADELRALTLNTPSASEPSKPKSDAPLPTDTALNTASEPNKPLEIRAIQQPPAAPQTASRSALTATPVGATNAAAQTSASEASTSPSAAKAASNNASIEGTASPASAPNSPRAACAPRTQFALYNCMKNLCKGGWLNHPQCVRLRITDDVN
jgi:serine/threonine protein kinase